jgi:DNA mismatch repair protein MutL
LRDSCPVSFVFVEIDPGLIDFNIHPAKKEVRFQSLAEVHAAVVGAVRSGLSSGKSEAGQPPRQPEAMHGASSHGQTLPLAPAEKVLDLPAENDPDVRFLGQVFGVFLVFELAGRLLILDQHAAHEKVIFERIEARAPRMQEMLFPLSFDVSEEEQGRLESCQGALADIGIQLKRAGARSYEIAALAEDLRSLREDVLVELVRGVGAGEWRSRLLATAACRLAIKEGEVVDPVTARELCRQALKLAVPRCPHGRPIWHEISEENLRKLVERPPKDKDVEGRTRPRTAERPPKDKDVET